MATHKQERLVEAISENLRSPKPSGIGSLMIKSGYSVQTSKRPGAIIKTQNFIELLERSGVTDKRITQVVKDGLFAKNGKKIDHNVRFRFVDLACKLKGHLKESDHGGLESIADLVSGLKEFDLDMLLVIKSKVKPAVEPIDVVQPNA